MWSDLVGRVKKALGMSLPPEPSAPAAAEDTESKPRIRQIYMGSCPELPEFARQCDPSDLVKQCEAHVVCKYTPHIEFQRLYLVSGRRDINGNMPIEYDGIAANCGAIKNFGSQVAQDEGLQQAYRYVDLNHILAHCCGTPESCPFYAKATGENSTLERRQRKLPEPDRSES